MGSSKDIGKPIELIKTRSVDSHLSELFKGLSLRENSENNSNSNNINAVAEAVKAKAATAELAVATKATPNLTPKKPMATTIPTAESTAAVAVTGLLSATTKLTTPTMEHKAEEGLVVENPFVDSERIAEKLPSKSRQEVNNLRQRQQQHSVRIASVAIEIVSRRNVFCGFAIVILFGFYIHFLLQCNTVAVGNSYSRKLDNAKTPAKNFIEQCTPAQCLLTGNDTVFNNNSNSKHIIEHSSVMEEVEEVGREREEINCDPISNNPRRRETLCGEIALNLPIEPIFGKYDHVTNREEPNPSTALIENDVIADDCDDVKDDFLRFNKSINVEWNSVKGKRIARSYEHHTDEEKEGINDPLTVDLHDPNSTNTNNMIVFNDAISSSDYHDFDDDNEFVNDRDDLEHLSVITGDPGSTISDDTIELDDRVVSLKQRIDESDRSNGNIFKFSMLAIVVVILIVLFFVQSAKQAKKKKEEEAAAVAAAKKTKEEEAAAKKKKEEAAVAAKKKEEGEASAAAALAQQANKKQEEHEKKQSFVKHNQASIDNSDNDTSNKNDDDSTVSIKTTATNIANATASTPITGNNTNNFLTNNNVMLLGKTQSVTTPTMKNHVHKKWSKASGIQQEFAGHLAAFASHLEGFTWHSPL